MTEKFFSPQANVAVWIERTGTVHERTAEDAKAALCGRLSSHENESDGLTGVPILQGMRAYPYRDRDRWRSTGHESYRVPDGNESR